MSLIGLRMMIMSTCLLDFIKTIMKHCMQKRCLITKAKKKIAIIRRVQQEKTIKNDIKETLKHEQESSIGFENTSTCVST